MCRYAMSFDQFREAVSYPDGEVPASNVRDEGFTYETTNFVMFPDDRYESPYARYMTGIKTDGLLLPDTVSQDAWKKTDLYFIRWPWVVKN